MPNNILFEELEQELSNIQKIVIPERTKPEPSFLKKDDINVRPKLDVIPFEERDLIAEFKQRVSAKKEVIETKPNLSTASVATPNDDGSFDFKLDFRTDEEIESGMPLEVPENDRPSIPEIMLFSYMGAEADIIRSAYLRGGMYETMNTRASLELGNKAHMQQMKKIHGDISFKFSERPVATLLRETSALMPFIFETIQQGVKYGIPLAFVYGAKKSLKRAVIPLPPKAKFILGVEGFIAGMKTGMAFAVVKTSIDVEGALIFGDLLEEGVDENTARVLGIAGGLMIGLTELAQLSLFSATYKRIFKKALTDEKAKAAIKVALLAALEAVGYNPAQEVVQEIIDMAIFGLASVIENNPNIMPEKDGIWNRLFDVWLKTFQGSIFLGILAGMVGGAGQRSRNRKLMREAIKKAAISEEEKFQKEDVIIVTEEEIKDSSEEKGKAFGKEDYERAKKVAASKAEQFVRTEEEQAKLKRRKEDIKEKFEKGEIDRRTFERRTLDVLQFEGQDALIKGIEELENKSFLPDSLIAFILENPEKFSKETVDFAEKKDIPEGTSAIEVEKIVEKRKEERREKERRQRFEAHQAELSRITRDEPLTVQEAREKIERLKESLEGKERKEALDKIREEQSRGIVIEVDGKKAFKFKRKDIPARINFLKNEIENIDKILDEKLKQIKLENDIKKLKTLNLKFLNLLEKQGELHFEILNLQNAEAKLAIDLGTKKVTLRAREVIALQQLSIKKKIEGIQAGIKQGIKIAKKDIRETQVALVTFLKEVETDPITRASLLAKVAKIQTQEQLEKILPEFTNRIDKAAEKAIRRLLIDNIEKLTGSRKLDKISSEFKPQIEAILKPFSKTKPTTKTVANLAWAAKTLRENNANQITQEELAILAELDKRPLAELSLRDLQLVHDSIAHLIHLNTEKQKLNEKGRNERQQRNVNEAIENLKENFDELNHSVKNLDDMFVEAETKIFKGFGRIKDLVGAAAWNTELIAEILDGKDDGIIMKVLYNGIDEGTGVAINYRTDSEQFLIDAGIRKLINKTWSESLTRRKSKVKKFTIQLDSGETLTLRRGTRISFMLLSRNTNTFRQLTEGGFVFSRAKHAEATKLTEADLKRIEESASKEEKKVADIISVYFNSFQKERLNEVFERLYGFSVAIEENYFPAHVSEFARKVSQEEYKGLSGKDEFVRNVLEGMGIFKKRRGGTEALVISDAFDVLTDSIRKTSNFIGLAEPLRDAKALFNSPEFKSAVVNSGKGKYLESLKDYLEKVEGSVFNNDNIGKLVQNWQSKIDVAVLAGNVWVFLKQPVSYWLASTEINMKYLIAGMRPVASSSLIERIKKWSPHLRERFEGNITLETGEIAEMGATRRIMLGKSLMSQKAMIGIHKFDSMAIASIWRAVEYETRAKHPTLHGDAFNEHVAARAWKIIRRTQPTFDMKDRSYVGRTSNTWLRLSTKYTSQRNKNLMIQRRLLARWNRSEGGAVNLGKLLTGFIMVNAIASSMIAGVNALRNLGADKKDIDEEEWKFYVSFVIDTIRTTLGNTYFIGNILDIALTRLFERKRGFGMTDPISRQFEQMGELLADIGKGIQMTTGEKPRYRDGRVKAEKERNTLIESVARKGLDVTSKIKGVPVYSTLRSLEIISKATGLVDKEEDVQRYKRRRY